MAKINSKMPVGLQRVFTANRGFIDREQPIIDRLKAGKHENYIKALHEVEYIFSGYIPPMAQGTIPVDYQWTKLLLLIAYAVLEFTPDKATKFKEGYKDLTNTIWEIQDKLEELTKLFSKMKRLSSDHNLEVKFDATCDYEESDFFHTYNLICCAARHSEDREKPHRFSGWIQPDLEKLSNFDYKYWPTPEELIEELSQQYIHAFVESDYREIKKQVHNKKSILLDEFFSALIFRINRLRALAPDLLSLSNKHWCSIINTATGVHNIDEQDIVNLKKHRKHLFQ